MSKIPSTDTDPWDRPVDVSEELISARAGGPHASEPQDAGVPARQKAPVPTRAIPDDWDDDPSSSDEDSRKIWDNAYVILLRVSYFGWSHG